MNPCKVTWKKIPNGTKIEYLPQLCPYFYYKTETVIPQNRLAIIVKQLGFIWKPYSKILDKFNFQ